MTNARQTCLLRLAANSNHHHLCQFFASKLPVCLGPFDLSGISLHLEVFVALTPTEVEHLNALAFSTTSLLSFHDDCIVSYVALTDASFRTKDIPWPG